MADFELLAPGGHQELVDEVLDRLDTKADYDGYYAQLTAGAADNLTGRGDGVSASYLYRTTGGDADVADGTATVKSIHGQTMVWNQLVSGTTAMTDQDGITTSYDETTHKFSITNVSRTTNFMNGSTRNVVVPAERTVAGHKYVIYGNLPVGVKLSVAYSANVSGVFTLTEANELRLRVTNDYDFVTAHPVGNVTSFYLNVTDLTAMFGAGNEPSTVAEFEALYPLPYYEYDAGSLLSVQMEGIETVGFNLFDPANLKTGVFVNATRHEIVSSSGTKTAVFEVFPNTDYCLTYDGNRCTIAGVDSLDIQAGDEARIIYDYLGKVSPKVFNSGDNHYVAAYLANADVTATNICINLSWSGYRDGEYEPYWKSERTIPAATYFPNGMRSAGTVYDELTSEEAVTRVGAVDLGTLTWVKGSTTTDGTAAEFVTLNENLGTFANAPIDAPYTLVPYGNWDNLTIGQYMANGSRIIIAGDPSLTEAEFKASLSGYTAYYALATPTTQPIDPPLNLSYRVSDFGTERIIHTAPSAPPTMQVVYGLNVVDTVRRLPTEYISHDSFTQFTNALATFLDATITESWDATDGRYEYTITQSGE